MLVNNQHFLSCSPIANVRVAIVGVGVRGRKAVERFVHISGSQITFLCDKNIQTLQNANDWLHEGGFDVNLSEDWEEVCKSNDVDLVYICTDWHSHTHIALCAMQYGKHVALEVPAAMTISECWQLVDAAEAYQRHCVILENCCYDAFELTTLGMVQCGVLGDIVHADCAYIHDLRSLNFPPTETSKKGMNRQCYNRHHNGNVYPTHALGPVCLSLDINRGDRLERLISMSSRQQGITDYAIREFGEDSEEALRSYQLGDMNTTIISTSRGASIMLQHDTNNPRPYSRIYSLTGTKGFCQKYPTKTIMLEKKLLSQKKLKQMLKKYRHPFLLEYYEEAERISGDHFFDYIMDKRLIYCLNNGFPTVLNVYDAATWSAIVELTEISVKNGNQAVEIPDFRRGKS